MYLFSLKLLLLVYFCSCSLPSPPLSNPPPSADGRFSRNFFLTSAVAGGVDAMTPN
jgi:hypothetical protein